MSILDGKLIEENVKPKELPKLSPSSINLFSQDKALWVLKHFYGSTSEYNIHAMRGTAVEDGINHYLVNKDIDVAISQALAEFEDMAFFWGDEELLCDIEQKIEPWVRTGIKALEELPSNPTQQEEIETCLEGVPLRGFLDYSWGSTQVDLKTATQVPNAISRGKRKGFLPSSKRANVRQQSIYHYATGKETALLYVTPDEYYLHTLSSEELEESFVEVVELVKEMKTLLTSDLNDVINNSVPNWKAMNYSFYWDDTLRKMANAIWKDFKPKEEEEGY